MSVKRRASSDMATPAPKKRRVIVSFPPAHLHGPYIRHLARAQPSHHPSWLLITMMANHAAVGQPCCSVLEIRCSTYAWALRNAKAARESDHYAHLASAVRAVASQCFCDQDLANVHGIRRKIIAGHLELRLLKAQLQQG